MSPAPSRARRVLRFFLGDRPRFAALIYAPTLLAIAMDVAVRPRALARLSAAMMGLYLASALAGSGLWGAILWLGSRLFLVREGPLRPLARAGIALLFGGLFLPFACFAYGGQIVYFQGFHAYISRDSVRMGIRLRGDVIAWLLSWGGGLATMIVSGVVATVIVALLVRRAAAPIRSATPVLPALLCALSGYCYWTDFIETRALQAAPPDACFMHGVVYAAKVAITGAPPRGVALRVPDPLPPLTPPAHRPNVVVILTESVRADALCSAPGKGCDAPFLDAIAPDRVALGKLTAQASGTFSACMMLWTGMPPDVDFHVAHHAPMLWELARAVGYRTGYVASQNLLYQDLGVYLQQAGIDVQASAVDLGEAPDVHIGAPDENATKRALDFAREAPEGTPYFVMVHLSNTHWPYRDDAALRPFTPHATSPTSGRDAYFNHYRNSVRLQERTIAEFLRALRAAPRWDDTLVILLSDHGEQFKEHGRWNHLNNLFDEEVQVPGFLLAGDAAITADQRRALATYAGRRTYDQDLHATLLDVFGVLEARASLPFGDRMTGRSLLRPRPREEPLVLLSTTSAVYEDDDAVYGVRRGELLVVSTEVGPLRCFDNKADPAQRRTVPIALCAPLVDKLRDTFPEVRKVKVE